VVYFAVKIKSQKARNLNKGTFNKYKAPEIVFNNSHPKRRLSMKEKSIWKTLPVLYGTAIDSMEILIGVLLGQDHVVGARRLCMKKASTFSLPTKPIQISIVSRKDLGLPLGASMDEFYREAIKAGYQLCTTEIGMLARLAYKPLEQIGAGSTDMWYLYIAMEPIEGEILRIGVGTRGPRLDPVNFDEICFDKSCERKDKWIFVVPQE
jgi:hypothetical protein